MVKRHTTLTAFGKDLDSLIKRAGKYTLHEYADESGVSYKYISQLRTLPNRRPGQIYIHLLKPFTRLQILNLTESHRLSLRHRGKPLSFTECKEIFPDLPEQEIVESIKRAVEQKDRQVIQTPAITIGISQSTARDNIYRRVFVGREAELGELRSAFVNALSGQGSLAMVAGEPGIGKTALTEQLANYVCSIGGKSLIGHCYSEKSLSLPYLAFVEILRSYIQERDVNELRKELGGVAADLCRIVPEIRQKLKVNPKPKGDPNEEKYHLMQSVTGFLSNIASVQPLLVILEDLHNADMGTLEMLTHVSRNLAGTRILIIGTYRDVEVDRTHPLSAALAELRRIPVFSRVLLRGLNVNEVSRMLDSITGLEMPWGLAEAIHRQTEGNPLFVQEVVRYLVEDGIISPQGEIKQKQKDLPVEMHIPDGLRDVIGKRLSNLSEQCNQLLAMASVIGREFPLVILQKMANIPDEDLFKVLEEAGKAAVVEERTGDGVTVNYRFTHAFFRQTLYEEIIAPRRIRLHQQVARAIEELCKNRLEEHATQLAEHFSHSSDEDDLEKAVSYGEIAAKRATDVYAYGEAVRLLDQAIKVQEILDPEDKVKKCDLLLDLCDALLAVPDTRRILDKEAPAAFSLTEAIGDGSRSIRICMTAQSAMTSDMAGPAFGDPKYYEWTERMDRYAKPGTVERAWTDACLGTIMLVKGQVKAGNQLLDQALELARRLGDPKILLGVGMLVLITRQIPQAAEENLKLAEEMMSSSKAGIRLSDIGGVFENMMDPFLTMGMRRRVQEALSELRAVTERTGLFSLRLDLAAWDASRTFMDGHLEDVINKSEQIRSRLEEAGVPQRADIAANMIAFRAKYYLGYDLEAFERAWRIEVGARITTGSSYLCKLCLTLAYLGRNKEASEIIERTVVRRPYIGTADDWVATWRDIMFIEACVLISHRQAAELLLNRFKGTNICTTGHYYITVVPRHLGGACALLGRYVEARKYYDEAIRICTEMRFRPEMALTRLQLAELLLEHYPNEKKEAAEHLDFAIKEFREMKMQPSLERALRHKEILKA